MITLRTGEQVAFSLEALEGVIEQVESEFIPLTVEHLGYLPPAGRLTGGRIITGEQGDSELFLTAETLPILPSSALTLQPSATEAGTVEEPTISSIRFSTEPRNFDKEGWEELQETAPLELTPHTAWSTLPPIIWTISLSVSGAVGIFGASFLKKLGDLSAEQLVDWLKAARAKTKDSTRDQLVEVRFVTEDGTSILGYCPVSVASEQSFVQLRTALDGLEPLANFAASVNAGRLPEELRIVTFIFDEGRWRLAWWTTNESVRVTPWF